MEPTTNTIFDLNKLYQTYFNKTPYYVTPKGSEKPLTQDVGYSIQAQNPRKRGTIVSSVIHGQPFNKIGAYGQDIWFPITIRVTNDLFIDIDACTVGVNLSKTIVRTAVSERKGTVKECFGIDDYKFNVKGFLIGKNRYFPEFEIEKLKRIFESTDPVELHGGYVELFLDTSRRVAISTLDFPEVQGKAVNIRPFTMTLETDYIENWKSLIVQ
jgi:hypothetical protein